MASSQLQHYNPNISSTLWPERPKNALIRNDRINRRVQPRSKHEQPQAEDENIEDSESGIPKTGEEVGFMHVVICDGPEDEAEEGVESGGHDGEEVAHGGDDTGVTSIFDAETENKN